MSGLRKLLPKRVDTERELLAQPILIFCEGATEFNYFLYFSSLLQRYGFNTLIINLFLSGSAGCKVVYDADEFLATGNNESESKRYAIYLAFDCDRPDSFKAIEHAKNNSRYTLLLNNRAIETWLCMHFIQFNQGELLSSKAAIQSLCEELGINNTEEYDDMKAKGGLVRAVLRNGDIELAIRNSKLTYGKGDLPEFTGQNKNLVYSSWCLLFEPLWDALRGKLNTSEFKSGSFIPISSIDYEKCKGKQIQINPLNIDDFVLQCISTEPFQEQCSNTNDISMESNATKTDFFTVPNS